MKKLIFNNKTIFILLVFSLLFLMGCQIYNYEQKGLKITEIYFQALNDKNFNLAKEQTEKQIYPLITAIERSNRSIQFSYVNPEFTVIENTNKHLIVRVFSKLSINSANKKSFNDSIIDVYLRPNKNKIKIYRFKTVE